MNIFNDNSIDPHAISLRKEDKKEQDELDLTPMVDVTFLLLIFFMITAAFALQKSIEVPSVGDDLAASQSVADLEQDSIVIRIDADNVYWVGAPRWEAEQQSFSKQDLLIKLREARENDGPAKLLVQADGDSRHEFVVAALDAGSGVGMAEIRLMSYEEGDLDL
jgi:biopolymer transport protein ExbD